LIAELTTAGSTYPALVPGRAAHVTVGSEADAAAVRIRAKMPKREKDSPMSLRTDPPDRRGRAHGNRLAARGRDAQTEGRDQLTVWETFSVYDEKIQAIRAFMRILPMENWNGVGVAVPRRTRRAEEGEVHSMAQIKADHENAAVIDEVAICCVGNQPT
jgi:hypothetical protein